MLLKRKIMQNILINNDFNKAIQRLRAILPKLSFTLLIATYVISAIIMGIFHAQNAPNIGFMIAAFLVPLAIQAGRGTLVFFFQLNPAQIQNKLSFGIIAATALLILSLIEAVLVLYPYGYTWIVSVSTLMLIGWCAMIGTIIYLLEAGKIRKTSLGHPISFRLKRWGSTQHIGKGEHEWSYRNVVLTRPCMIWQRLYCLKSNSR